MYERFVHLVYILSFACRQAFYTMHHRKLIEALVKAGIDENLIKLVEMPYSDSTFFVEYNDCQSTDMFKDIYNDPY